MTKPKPIPEDPALKAAQLREQARAEAAQATETQGLLNGDTLARLRRFGNLPGAQPNVDAPSPGGLPNPAMNAPGILGIMARQLFNVR